MKPPNRKWRFKTRHLDCCLIFLGFIATMISFYASALRAPAFAEQAPCFLTMELPFSDTLLNLSTGIVVSVLFYFLIVRVPERARRTRLRNRLIHIYRSMRLNIMEQILSASGEHDGESSLLANDSAECRKFFATPKEQDTQEWEDTVKSLDKWHVQKIKMELQIFRDEIHYVLDKIDVEDVELADYMKNLSSVILEMSLFEADHDDQKTWGKFLWNLFTFHDFERGYLSEDPVFEMLRKI